MGFSGPTPQAAATRRDATLVVALHAVEHAAGPILKAGRGACGSRSASPAGTVGGAVSKPRAHVMSHTTKRSDNPTPQPHAQTQHSRPIALRCDLISWLLGHIFDAASAFADSRSPVVSLAASSMASFAASAASFAFSAPLFTEVPSMEKGDTGSRSTAISECSR